jgi:hypothetical protein
MKSDPQCATGTRDKARSRESIAVRKWRAAISGLAAALVLGVTFYATTRQPGTAFTVGVLVGMSVFVSQWLVAVRRR